MVRGGEGEGETWPIRCQYSCCVAVGYPELFVSFQRGDCEGFLVTECCELTIPRSPVMIDTRGMMTWPRHTIERSCARAQHAPKAVQLLLTTLRRVVTMSHAVLQLLPLPTPGVTPLPARHRASWSQYTGFQAALGRPVVQLPGRDHHSVRATEGLLCYCRMQPGEVELS